MKTVSRLLIAGLIAALPLHAAAELSPTNQKWARQVRELFMKNIPKLKEPGPGEWRVVVEIIVRRDGRVRRSSILQSSGFAPVDAAAMQMLTKTMTLPAFPPDMDGTERTLRMPVVFLGTQPDAAQR